MLQPLRWDNNNKRPQILRSFIHINKGFYMFTKIDLCSAALLKLGENPIVSFNDQSAAANLANTLYDVTIDSLLASHPWRFAMKKFDLTKDVYEEFVIPADVLRILQSNGEVVGNKIISHYDEITITAIVKTDVEFFPSYFNSLAAIKLAMEFCIPLLGDQNIFKMLVALYESELRTAKFIDSTISTNSDISDFSLISARF